MGYQSAAELGEWTLTRTRATPEPEYMVEAAIQSSDDFWIAQRPMDLELAIGNRRWVWTGVDPAIGQQSLAVTLIGAPAIH